MRTKMRPFERTMPLAEAMATRSDVEAGSPVVELVKAVVRSKRPGRIHVSRDELTLDVVVR